MTTITQAVERIRLVHAALGSTALAKMTSIPLTTICEASTRGFRGKSIEIFDRLVAAAEAADLSEEALAAARAKIADTGKAA